MCERQNCASISTCWHGGSWLRSTGLQTNHSWRIHFVWVPPGQHTCLRDEQEVVKSTTADGLQ